MTLWTSRILKYVKHVKNVYFFKWTKSNDLFDNGIPPISFNDLLIKSNIGQTPEQFDWVTIKSEDSLCAIRKLSNSD